MRKTLSDRSFREAGRSVQDFVRARAELWKGLGHRMLVFKWALCLALLSELALCPKLWMSDRAFPTLPAFAGLPDLPQSVCLVIAWFLVASVVAVALLPRPGIAVYAVPVFGALLVLFDITRLQPWFYQYMLMFVGLGKTSWEKPGADRSRPGQAACIFILAATYFWSGLQKANLSFAENVFPWLLRPLGLDHFRALWFAAPVLEVVIGILLILPRTRGWGLAAAVAMHALLLVALGPFGQNFNPVVWPWNLAMPVMASILLFRNSEPVIPLTLSTSVGRAIFVLVGIMPAFSFIGRWDDYLSASLYSGKLSEAFILLTKNGARLVPPPLQPYVQHRSDRIGLDVARWAMSELGVPPYPEPRVYKALARKLEEMGVPSQEMTLIIADRKSVFAAKPEFRPVPIR